jgi:predicted HicB family RNase H-like nuclease
MSSYMHARRYLREWRKRERKYFFPQKKSVIRYENSWRGNIFQLVKEGKKISFTNFLKRCEAKKKEKESNVSSGKMM